MTFQERQELETALARRICNALGRRMLDHQLGAEPSGGLQLEQIVKTAASAVLDDHIGASDPPP